MVKHRHNKLKRGKRRAGIHWEYDGDGRFPRDRIKGIMKRYWSKWLGKHLKKRMDDGYE